MILIDFSQIMISNLSVSLKGNMNVQLDENRLRNMILHSLKHYRQKFKADFGDDFVVCCDSRIKSWRHEVFPYYKIRRARSKEKSALDWPAINLYFDKIISEIKENLPYRTIKIDRAEADDVIGTLCRHAYDNDEKVMIVSCDQDFHQLVVDLPNVFMYNHIEKREVRKDKISKTFLFEKIIRGDSGDDVPNILTQDDTFAIQKRSKPLTEKKLQELISTPMTSWTKEEYARFSRNQVLIDLAATPEDIKTQIITTYNSESGKSRSRIYSYFVKNRLKDLVDNIQEF
jgi:5'-3' exonuclease